jgi:hypothetical protein
MAKKITDEQNSPVGDATVINPALTSTPPVENTPTENENITGTETEKTESEESKTGTQEPDKETPVAPQPKPVTPAPVAANYPPFVEVMLKAFPGYELLYVDSHGGTYAPNTSPQVRGNAVLYKNPYHKP